jgi:Raf kinase inhibitor-like YbhB/YbcL family protein
MFLKRGFFFALILLILTGMSCSASPANTPQGEVAMAIQITSTAFSDGGTIPQKYTCDGENVSPPLAWAGIPAGTRGLALIVDDPDAPRGTWVHWVMFNIPAGQASLPEGAQGMGTQGVTDFGNAAYGGPCPPAGKPHRYFFKLYALDSSLSLKAGATKAEVEKAMQGHILVQGQLMGKYGR